MSPFQVVRDFEKAVCDYTGAPYCVAVTSCTDALKLAVAWHMPSARFGKGRAVPLRPEVEIPKRTYVGVGMAITHAGGRVTFRDESWAGAYQLKPLPVWDSARYFTSWLYKGKGVYDIAFALGNDTHRENSVELDRDCSGKFVCVSFHASKTCGDTHGGAILHDSPEADKWLRRARFDGRTEGVAPKDDTFDVLGHHCYMSPDVAARLLWKLSVLPKHNEPLPWGPGTNSDYPDLSLAPIFQ